jgi:hypothetical protein
MFLFRLFSHRILGITEGITHLVGLKWDLLATLLIAWGIVYLIICKGLHASGKVKTTFILGLFSSTTE